MTTDTVPKGASRRVTVDGVPVTVTGIAKGSGMIHPDMATMLAFVATDAPVAAALLATLAREIADVSFNCATVDGDTSTNDSFVLAATGKAAMAPIERADDPRLAPIRAALTDVATALAQAIVRDGEGATKFIDHHRRGRPRRRRMPARSRSASPIRRSSRPHSSPPIPTSAASSARSAMPPRATSTRRLFRSGSTTCRWSPTVAARLRTARRTGSA